MVGGTVADVKVVQRVGREPEAGRWGRGGGQLVSREVHNRNGHKRM